MNPKTIYRIEQYVKGPRQLTLLFPVMADGEGLPTFRGRDPKALKVFNRQTGQQAHIGTEFDIDADDVFMAFEMYDDAKNKAAKAAQKEMTQPKITLPDGTVPPLPVNEEAKL